MAGGGAPPGRRPQRPLLRVRRARGGLGQEGDRLAAAPAERTGGRLRRGRVVRLRGGDPPGPRDSPPPTSPGAWSRGGSAPRSGPSPPSGPARLWQVLRFGRGCLSYVVARGEDAVVVDAHRGLDAYRGLLEREGLRLRAAFDTHLHADHVSGGPALARAAGVGYHASLRDFEGGRSRSRSWSPAGRCGSAGSRSCPIVPLGTPGHTPGQHVAARRRRVPPDRGHALRRRRRAAGPRRPGGGVGAGPLPDAPRAAPAARRRHRGAPGPREHLRGIRRGIRAARRRGRHARRPPAGGTAPCDSSWTPSSVKPSTPPARRPAEYARIRAINLGRETAAETS